MIARSVVVEALILGVLGSLLGVLFGFGMAKGLVYLFGRAFLFEITELWSSLPFALISAIVVGIAVTVVAALYPAMRPGRVSPVEAMRARSSGAAGETGRSRGVSLLAPGLGPRARRRRGSLDLLPRKEPLGRASTASSTPRGSRRSSRPSLASPSYPRLGAGRSRRFSRRAQAPLRRRGEDGRGERDAQQGKDGANGFGPHGRHLARRGLLRPRRKPPRLDPGLPGRLPRQRLRSAAHAARTPTPASPRDLPDKMGSGAGRREDDQHRLDLPRRTGRR